MAIPASHIVDVLPRVIPGGSADLELNGLLLSENPLISASAMVLEFTSAAAVGDYFGQTSAEYAAADVYFTGYANKLVAPRSFFVARRVKTAVAAWLRGGRFTRPLAECRALTDGKLTLGIDNATHTLEDVSFAGATSYSDMAEILENALQERAPGARVAYSSLTGAFTVTSPTPGASSEVSCAACSPADGPEGTNGMDGTAGTDLASFLRLRESDGAVRSEGLDALSVAGQMTKIRARTENWVTFTTVAEADAADMLAWAAWANANYGWLYVAYTTDPATTSPETDTDPASLLKDSGNDHTAIIYGSLEYAAFIMGTVASVAWQRVNGTITAAFKKQAGLAPWVTDQAAAAVLEKKNCNYFGNFATRNAEFVFLYPGCLSASDYGFIDPYVNSVWLNNRLQIALMDGITAVGRLPYTTRGYTMIKAWMMGPVNDARANAAIEPGVTLSERQKTELMNEAGRDISRELWTQGYYAQVLDPGAAARTERKSPIISLWYTYGGAVQKIEVASTALV